MKNEKMRKLGEATQFKKGQSGNPEGRPKSLVNVIEEMPRDARVRCYTMLHSALLMPDLKSAEKYLRDKVGEGVEYGCIAEIAIRELRGYKGFDCLMTIMDRLFGKPIQSTEIVGDLRVEQARNLTPEEAAEVMAALEKLKGGE